MGRTLILIIALAFFAFAAPPEISAQKDPRYGNYNSFDPSDDFKKTYADELKKNSTWQSNKKRGQGDHVFNQPSGEAANKKAAPPPPASPNNADDYIGESGQSSSGDSYYSYPASRGGADIPPPPADDYSARPAGGSADIPPPPADNYYAQPASGGADIPPPPADDYYAQPASGGADIPPPPADNYYAQPASGGADIPPAQADNYYAEPASGSVDIPQKGYTETNGGGLDIPQPSAPVAPPPALPAPATLNPTQAISSSEGANYANSDSWMYLPQRPDREVDIFFLYTGSCGRPGICSASDPGMRRQAAETTAQQASVFEPIGNLYVPYYRQVTNKIFIGLSHEDRLMRLGVSMVDTMAAFDYYMRNHNNGRPYILAAHGQGSATLLYGILANYLRDNPEAKSRLVAAYAIGYSLTSDYLTQNDHMRVAERRNDTGVIISYTTEAPDMKASNPLVLPRSVPINPVNWTRSERRAPKENSKGANLSAFGEDAYVKDFADARVDMSRGAVTSSTVDAAKYSDDPDFPYGAYPKGDYAFFYYDLRANAQERVDAYRASRP